MGNEFIKAVTPRKPKLSAISEEITEDNPESPLRFDSFDDVAEAAENSETQSQEEPQEAQEEVEEAEELDLWAALAVPFIIMYVILFLFLVLPEEWMTPNMRQFKIELMDWFHNNLSKLVREWNRL